jgi:hypothetical protein
MEPVLTILGSLRLMWLALVVCNSVLIVLLSELTRRGRGGIAEQGSADDER